MSAAGWLAGWLAGLDDISYEFYKNGGGEIMTDRMPEVFI